MEDFLTTPVEVSPASGLAKRWPAKSLHGLLHCSPRGAGTLSPWMGGTCHSVPTVHRGTQAYPGFAGSGTKAPLGAPILGRCFSPGYETRRDKKVPKLQQLAQTGTLSTSKISEERLPRVLCPRLPNSCARDPPQQSCISDGNQNAAVPALRPLTKRGSGGAHPSMCGKDGHTEQYGRAPVSGVGRR